MNPLLRRLAKLESEWGDGQLLLVAQYPGMTRDEALRLRFGPEGPPPGAELVVVVNALPPDGVEYAWAERRGVLEYGATWAQLSGKSPE